MNFRDRLLSEEGFAGTDDGFKVTLRLPRYRSLPLSCFEVEQLRVDGDEIPSDAMAFHVNDRTIPLRDLGDLVDEWWFVADPAEVRVTRPGGLADGPHDVDVTLRVRIPYVFAEGGSEVLTEIAGASKTLTYSSSS